MNTFLKTKFKNSEIFKKLKYDNSYIKLQKFQNKYLINKTTV